ncbi:MAG: DUF2589 domain-containing protein, partial [Archaeoglobi archaeon]|nr:DUF2589 domain-containing protein [Archaeoglobi archaeon]
MSSNLAVLLQQIISSPLRAVIDAQEESAKATLDFIASTMEKKAGKLVPKAVNVGYTQAYIDPDTGELKTEDLTLSVPLVTMVPIPYISVDEVEIEFDAKIVAVRPEKKVVQLYA